MDVVTFEPGSQLRRLESGTFLGCLQLKSICIAASVESIARDCFAGIVGSGDPPLTLNSWLETVTFEQGSVLREIERDAFQGCRSLSRICIPASVEEMTGGSFPDSPRCQIDVEPGNRYFDRQGDFVMSLNHDVAVRYFGPDWALTIPDEIETIGESCFRSCPSLEDIDNENRNHENWHL
jgi:hypothetical protein